MKDPYILPNGTLKNKLGIQNEEELNKAEKDIAFVKLISVDELNQKQCTGDLLKQIHLYLFQDIYEWAGEYRTVPIYKEELVLPGLSLEYARPEEIEDKLNKELQEMNSYEWNNKKADELSIQFTKSLAKIWRVHPFRDGNTRTVLTFANIFSKIKGFNLDMESILDNLTRKYDEKTGRIIQYSVRDKFVLASLDEKDYPEPEHLQMILKNAIENGIKNQINDLKNIILKEDEGR